MESEEAVNRIRISNGEELIMARKYTPSCLPLYCVYIVAILGGESKTLVAKGMDAERVGVSSDWIVLSTSPFSILYKVSECAHRHFTSPQ